MATSTSMTASCVVIVVWSPESLPQKSPKKKNAMKLTWWAAHQRNTNTWKDHIESHCSTWRPELSQPTEMGFAVPKPIFKHQTAQLGNSFAFLSRTSSTCRVFSKQPWFVFGGVDSARCQVIYRKYLSDETFEGQEAANLQATTQTFVVSDSWIELKVLVIQNEFHFHVLVLVKGILGMTRIIMAFLLLHLFSWIHRNHCNDTKPTAKGNLLFLGNVSGLMGSEWPLIQTWFCRGFLLLQQKYETCMRLLEPKWLVFWFSKGLFFKGCFRVPGCALHQGSIHPKSQVSPEGTWKLRLRTRISQSDSFSLLRKANLPRLKHPCKSEVERIGEAKHIVVGLFPLAPLPTGLLHV